MQKTRKTNGVVRRNITEALFELMKEKPLDDISITELTRRAQVARVSFYRNFDNKEDVLRQDARRVTEEWLGRVGSDLRQRDPRAFVRTLFEHFLEEREVTELLVASGKADILREELDRTMGVGCEDRGESARRAFLSGGLSNLAVRWVLAGYDPDARTLADFVYELVR